MTTSLLPRRAPASVAAAAALCLAVASCSSDPTTEITTGSDTGAAAAGSTSDGTTTAGVQAAQWGDNVTITIEDGSFRFESDGLPDHEIPDQFLVPQTGSFTPPVTESEVSAVDSDVAVVASPVDETITLDPVYTDEVTQTDLGLIGVTISGAQLFNDYEDNARSFVAVDDNFSVGGVSFVDSCNGHPLALLADGTGAGSYHYHGVPYCLTDEVDVEGEHSSVLGFLVDGFPFYGPQDEGGETITSDELDECSGHVGATPEFPEGIYHYHLTEDRSPYTVDCYHGEVETAGPDQPGGAPGAS
ncbi:MAG: YHYH protein [Nocardioides marinisabuli]|uniref:YHYH protein n=1 Tax=Nocardioides marinisabuli TaxID=419476 RepID=UPI00321AA95F